VDMSGSMAIDDITDVNGNERSRWDEMQESVLTFAEVMDTLDPDGIDFTLFNDAHRWQRGVHKDDIAAELKKQGPRGGTVLAPVLQAAFDEFFKKMEPTIIVVISDGCPEDKDAVIKCIVAASKKLAERKGKDSDLGLQIVQVGTDKGARAFLQMLDDQLQEKYGAPFDIVDTTAMDEVAKVGGLKQVLLNAIND